MTNPSTQRKDVISKKEFENGLTEVEEAYSKIENREAFQYYVLRDPAILCIFRTTGKRREEVATLEVSDLEKIGENLSIIFTVVKKRKTQIHQTRREKQIPIKDPYTYPVLNYWSFIKALYPEVKYLFPRTYYNPLSKGFRIDSENHLSGRQLLNIVKKSMPNAWCHLFRETVGADIIRSDPTIMAPFRVMQRLDLEDFRTAFNYMRRFAIDVIEREKIL